MDYLLIKINGEALPTPSDYQVSLNDLDAQGDRPITTGKLKRKRIRKNVLSVDLVYLLKDFPNTSEILQMIDDETFKVDIYDAVGGVIASKTMYAGPKKYGYVVTQFEPKAQGLSISLVEV